jgi:tetratricopeptide (TPR) repeat protein
MFSRFLQWIKDLPNTVKVLIGLISTIIPAVILLRTNFKLGIVALLAIILSGALSSLAYIALAKNKSAIGFSAVGAVGYKYPRQRRWALAGICALVLVCSLLFVLRSTRYYILAALKGTEVVPRADIIVAQFDSALASKKFEIPNRIRTNLERVLRKYNLRDVRVETVPDQVISAREANGLADQAGAKVVVWGWYDDLGVTINLYTPEPTSSDDEILKLKEVAWDSGPRASTDISLEIRERLPDDITFLSLFILGTFSYQNNDYQKGHQAFDAAMDSMPKEIRLENEALVHFFEARSLEAAGGPDAERIICEYSRAIELNPKFAAAYNNLGIFSTKLLIAQNPDPETTDMDSPISNPSDRMNECIGKAGYEDQSIDNNAPYFFFTKALEAQPDSAVIQFNRVASIWTMWDGFNDSSHYEALAVMLDTLLARDPSIPGAHIMRGALAFENEGTALAGRELQIALKQFSTASQLMPRSYKLHINVGKVYMRQGQYPDARAEFEKALALSPDSAEAHLAIADAALKQGQVDMALRHLGAVSSDQREDFSAARMAAILKARIEFEAGNVAVAIQTLQANLSQQPEPASADSDDTGPGAKLPLNNDTSLIHYLLGLLYTLDSDTGNANNHFKKCKIPDWGNDDEDNFLRDSLRDQAHSYRDTATVAWCDILLLCASGSLDISRHGMVGQCLPQDVSQRLKKVFDIAQDRISYRIFYRRKVEFAGLG